MEKSTIESYYQHELSNAAKYSKSDNSGNDLYNFHSGMTHAYGLLLDYEYDRIEGDIRTLAEKMQE